ncbi:MAG: GspE/PulE family protein [Hydrogenophilus sp.]|nr:GspE/PulE family protein [Hydrogenophilus sp.]
MPLPRRVRLGELLVQAGVVTPAQLEMALAKQRETGRKLGQVLVESGYTTEDAIYNALARQLKVPFFELKRYPLDPEVVKKLPEHLARRHRCLLLKWEPEPLLGMSDPTNLFAYDEVAQALGVQPQIAIVRDQELLQVLDDVYRQTERIERLARDLTAELQASRTAVGFEDLLGEMPQTDAATEATVAKLLQSILDDAVAARASDVHIEPDEHVLRIRLRVDGVLQEQVMEERGIAAPLISRVKLVAGMDITERRRPQDGRFQAEARGKVFDIRVSSLPTQHGESVVLRLLSTDLSRFSLDKLGMPPEMLARFRKQLRRPNGVILVTGPTGSGKTTTLYAALRELNEPGVKIITAEDPVEYRLERVNQVQVKPEIGLSFAEILRTSLRQDPDIILIGEMRDSETVEIGLRAAVTGHLVLSTLHTIDAPSTVVRLLDMGAPAFMLAASLRLVLAQRLVRRVCSECAEHYRPETHLLHWLEQQGLRVAEANFRRGRGCNLCHNSGYRGRVGVYEFFEPSAAMLDALRAENLAEYARLVTAAQLQGHFRTLLMQGLELAAQGITTVDEVIAMTGEVV